MEESENNFWVTQGSSLYPKQVYDTGNLNLQIV